LAQKYGVSASGSRLRAFFVSIIRQFYYQRLLEPYLGQLRGASVRAERRGLSGGNAWAALCVTNEKVGQFSESQILALYCSALLEPILNKNRSDSHAPRAWWLETKSYTPIVW